MNNFQAVIFDMDGTLIDSMQLWRNVDREFLHTRGLIVPPDIDLVCPIVLKVLCRNGQKWSASIMKRILC